VSEFELLAEIRRRLAAEDKGLLVGPGDDAAVTRREGFAVTSVDAVVEGVHFERRTSPLASIGHKALAAALSDLAAMGAEAGEAYTVIGIPTDLDRDGCLEILAGLEALAGQTGTSLAGGDITRSPVLFLAMTVAGHAESLEQLVTRAGAEPGDALAVTGELGGAGAGLALLTQPDQVSELSPELRGALEARQLEPTPRLAAGRALAAAGATAMIDLSDGLGADAGHLAAESGARLEIDAETLPLAPGLGEVAAGTGADPLELAVSAGEDYELLAAIDPDRFETAVAALGQLGLALTRIGEVVAGEGLEIRRPGGGLLEPRGFDQLRDSSPG
jgi:thiamine-monophosphate kinase